MITSENVIEHYALIQYRLKLTFKEKIQAYGIKMYHGQSQNFRYWAAFFNCRRKTLRLEQLTLDATKGDVKAREKLLSDYKDLANYAIMAIQILEGEEDGV